MREQFREMVAYLLKSESTEDSETIESYTDTMMFAAEEYHQEKLKENEV